MKTSPSDKINIQIIEKHIQQIYDKLNFEVKEFFLQMKIRTILKSILIGIPVGITIIDSVGYVARVDGISMQPALNPIYNQTDYVFLNRWAVKSYQVKRGDIIALISPKDPTLSIIKRIVGIQGDIIETISYKNHIVRVPEGHCWVEGDHTGHSMDSNNFGPISLGLITAKASCIVWPPSRWQFLNSSLPETRLPLNLSSPTFLQSAGSISEYNMRAISLVNRIEFEFTGNVARNAIALGDLDNDGCNELVVGNDSGSVAIFKGRKKLKTISKLSFVACLAIGDILNDKQNYLVIVTADGWCHIYRALTKSKIQEGEEMNTEDVDTVDGQVFSGESTEGVKDDSSSSLKKESEDCEDGEEFLITSVHVQRIPANAKDILLADVNGDGFIEMVLGLTDRVVRSYRWEYNNTGNMNKSSDSQGEKVSGKLVALNKWECANQIGSVTLHHTNEGVPCLLVAQPGGTFMRIKCQNEYTSVQDLENSETSTGSSSNDSSSSSLVDYQYLGISRMRNQNISTEILGDFKTDLDCKTESKEEEEVEVVETSESRKGRSYAVATLDGTIMLVRNEVILWAMAVDHQIFALTKLDVTGNGLDDIVVCSWDGQTYILDKDKNSVRFHLEQPVQAFNSGHYNLTPNDPDVTCFVYVTFKNTVIIYYDIPLKDLVCRKFEPDLSLLATKLVNKDKTMNEVEQQVKNLDKNAKKNLVNHLLYNYNS